MRLENDLFTVVSRNEGGARVSLHADHPIYRAHFPGNPITPGVCIVQMIGELVGGQIGRRLSLSAITNLKFSQPLSPMENPQVDILLKAVKVLDGGQVKVQGSITTGETVFTKFSITYE